MHDAFAVADCSLGDLGELAREVLRTERDAVIELRNKEAINGQALRRIQREMERRHITPKSNVGGSRRCASAKTSTS